MSGMLFLSNHASEIHSLNLREFTVICAARITWIFRVIDLITGLPYGNPSLKVEGICSVLFFFFSSVSVKVLPVTPLLSGIFVHRAI